MKLRSCRSLWFGMLIAAVFRPGGGPAARADSIAIITSSKDTMIFQNNPNNSLGGGIVMYAGTNSAPSIRRGLFAFDIADNIPQGAIIASAQLTLTYAAASGGGGGGGGNTGSPNLFDIGIYRLLANWGEGTVGTGTGTSGVGQGQPANPGDATWSHAFWNTTPWSNPGGDFVSTASAVTPVGGLTLNVPFTWGSTSQMVADVQQWLNDPSSNFGWILRGQETDPGTFRGFYTREETTVAYRPTLTVDYVPQQSVVPEPPTLRLALVAMAIVGSMVVCRSRRQGVLRASNDSSSLPGPRPEPA